MLKKIIAVIMVFCLAIACMALAEEGKTYNRYVKAYSGLKVHAEPDLKSEVVVAAMWNQKVTVDEVSGPFSHVSFTAAGQDYEGWVWTGYLSTKINKIIHFKSSKKSADEPPVEPCPVPPQPSSSALPF